MKNATELLTIYRIAEIIGIITLIAGLMYLIRKLNSKLYDFNFI